MEFIVAKSMFVDHMPDAFVIPCWVHYHVSFRCLSIKLNFQDGTMVGLWAFLVYKLD